MQIFNLKQIATHLNINIANAVNMNESFFHESELHSLLGSCVLPVFIGYDKKRNKVTLAAAHIVLAQETYLSEDLRTYQSASNHISHILSSFESKFGISKSNIRCIGLFGGNTETLFNAEIGDQNTIETLKILKEHQFKPKLNHTGYSQHVTVKFERSYNGFDGNWVVIRLRNLKTQQAEEQFLRLESLFPEPKDKP